jgi:Flp pilus assembly protein TadD
MVRPLAKSSFVLIALGLCIFASSASWAEDADPKALNRQINQLIEQGKYQEAIHIAERAVAGCAHDYSSKSLNADIQDATYRLPG